MTDTRNELVTEVIDIYAEPESFPREDTSEHAEKILRLIDEAVTHRDAEIREALLSTDHEGPVHKAMSVWRVAEHLYRQNSEGEPTHEAAMAFATAAIEQALIVAGLAEKGEER